MVLFYIVVYGVWLYAAYVVIVALQRLRRGLKNSLANRISIIRRSQTYVLGYVVIGFLTLFIELSLYGADYKTNGGTDADHDHSSNSLQRGLSTTTAVIDACAGVVSFIILYVVNKEEVRAFFQAKDSSKGFVANVVLEDLSLKPHLNSALRAEILYYTTLVSGHMLNQSASCVGILKSLIMYCVH